MLKITLLGEFGFQINDTDVSLPSRAAQSLLAYLALHPHKALRREKLAGLFWPDTTDAKARSHLRHVVWRLRKTLNRHRVDGYACIPEDPLHVRFCPPAPCWVDAVELLHPAPPALSPDQLIAQLELYAEFLPGFNRAWDEWTDEWRERVERIFVLKALCLIDRLVQAERWHEAIYWSNRLLLVNHGLEPIELIQQHTQCALLGLIEEWKQNTPRGCTSSSPYAQIFWTANNLSQPYWTSWRKTHTRRAGHADGSAVGVGESLSR